MANKLDELFERIRHLEEEVFGMDREMARHILKGYDDACRADPSYFRGTDPTITKAEKVLGA